MDYGQNSQNTPQNFFTAGEGTNDTSKNFGENNLDNSTEWAGNRPAPQLDPKQLGNAAINGVPVERPAYSEPEFEQPEFEMPETPELGVIMEPQEPAPAPQDAPAVSFDPNLIRNDKNDTFSPAAVKEVDREVKDLGKTKDAGAFYNDLRQMMAVNIKNNYGENATWKGAA